MSGKGSGVLRAGLWGGGIAILVCGLLVAVGYYLRSPESPFSSPSPDNVLLVIASPAPDGAATAGLIGTVAGGRLTDVDPETTVTIPGTSSSKLGDAYTFGGGAGVVAAAQGQLGSGSLAYVAVPQATWGAAVTRAGGARVTLPDAMAVFDGTTLTTLSPGQQTLDATQVAAVVRGLSYLPVADRQALRAALLQGVSAALATTPGVASEVQSDLPAKTLDEWLTDTLLKAAGR